METTSRRTLRISRTVDLLLAAGLSFCLLQALGSYFILPIEPLFLLSRLLLLGVIIGVLQFKPVRWTVLGLLAVLALISLLQALNTETTFWTPALQQYTQWLTRFATVAARPHDVYVPLTYTLLTLIIYLPIYLLMRVHLHTPLFLAGAAVFIAQSMFKTGLDWLLFIVFLLLLALSAARQIYSQRTHEKPFRAAAGVLPLCLLLALCAGLLPKPDNALPLPAINELANKLGLSFLSKSALFSTGFTGTTLSDGDLGGGRRANNMRMLSVSNGYSTYLRGHTFDTYTGRKWERSDQTLRDFTPFVNNADLPPESTRSTTITYHALRTDVLLQPTLLIDAQTRTLGLPLMTTHNGTLFTDGDKSEGFTYTVTSYYPRLTTDAYENVLRGSVSPLQLFTGGTLAVSSAIPPYAAPLMQYFTALSDVNDLMLPSSLPTRVGALAYELTAGHSNDYDKANAIAEYLRNEFTYTTDMEETPEGEDFVDYFLFEQKKGYCTYFASAFVVLCRSVNIPARYASGFVLVPDGKPGQFSATGNQAHAWGEVNFPGIGWVAFESTPPYGGYGDPVAAPTATPAPSATPRPSRTPRPSLTPRPSTTAPVTSVAPSTAPTPVASTAKAFPLWVLWIVLPLALLALWLSACRRRNKHRYTIINSGGSDGLKLLWKTILSTMPAFDLPRNEHETLREYALRLTSELSPLELRPAANELDALVFGQIEPEPDTYGDCYTAWLAALKQRNGTKYFVRRHLLGRL